MRTAKTDETGRMPRLICVFAGCTLTLLVLSQGGSFIKQSRVKILPWASKNRNILYKFKNKLYRKFPKYSDTQKICCNHSKI